MRAKVCGGCQPIECAVSSDCADLSPLPNRTRPNFVRQPETPHHPAASTVLIMSRIPLAYPKIPGSQDARLTQCIAFEKYDGTNLHWVWERELGWYAFGTRRDRFDFDERGIAEFRAAHPGLEPAPDVFLAQLADDLESIFRDDPAYRWPEITAFTEYLGERSFAGRHVESDSKRVVLFDVETPEGIVDPASFVDTFGHLANSARVIYRGKLTGKFLDDVRRGTYGELEGVVCKGGTGSGLWMAKVKTDAYQQRLKNAFAGRWEDYWE